MKDKSLIQILFEFLIGIIMMIPLSKFNSDGKIWISIMRVLYSFGIMLAMTKIMSIAYRIISCIFRRIMLRYQKSYEMLYFVFICSGIVVWNSYSNYFSKGYFVTEIIAYILFAFWFLIDIHTTKCFCYIMFLYKILNFEVEKHGECVDTYKKNMNGISKRKNMLVKELESYFPKKILRDPLKDLRRNIDFSRVDKYLQRIPSFQGAYKGIEGFFSGRESIDKFESGVERYLGNLSDDERWMNENPNPPAMLGRIE